MKITIRDKEYRIGFSYTTETVLLWFDKPHPHIENVWRRVIRCSITCLGGRLGVAKGRALTRPGDQHVRAVGRRIALAKALRAMALERHERKNVWVQVWESGMKKPPGKRR